jgi:two-component system cell cycle sensor histidine kinase/response regulator CckA
VATVGWLLVAFAEEVPSEERGRSSGVERAFAIGALGVAIAWLWRGGVFLSDEALLLPPVMWLAVRFGPRGGAAGITAAAVASVLAAAGGGHGHVGTGLDDPLVAALSMQIFIGAIAAPTAFVAAVVAERIAADQQRILLSRAMDQSADGLGIFTADGTILWANAATSRFYGRPVAELLGKRAWELLPNATEAKWRARWERLAERGVMTLEQRTRAPDGRLVPWEVTVAYVKGARRSVAVAALRDTSDRQRAAEALRLAGIGTLAAGVAHEINNPLASVVGNLALVRERLSVLRVVGGGPALARFAQEWLEPIEDAEDGARRVRDVVAELRVFARSEAERGPVDVARAMRSALSLAQSEIQHRARLVTRIGEVPPIRGSEGRLAQAFANVLVNAARAIPEGASQENEVRVEVRAKGADVVAEVSDTGVGMTAEVRARIFEPFFTTRGVGEGSGLGLAVTHAIVTAMRGRIDVDSAPAAGTRLRITLPATGGAPAAVTPVEPAPPVPSAPVPNAPPAHAAPPVPAPAAPGATPAPEARRLRILVVDDEPLVARSLQRILARDHDVEVSDRGREALDRIASGARYDAIICDLMMPDVSGIALHDEVRILDPDLQPRIVFVTGGAFTEGARDFLERVPNVRLEKPVEPRTLREAIAAIAPRG